MEFLEGVVRQDQRTGLLGNPQDESISPADGPGRRGDHLAPFQCLFEGSQFRRIDAMSETGVDDDNHVGGGKPPILLEEGLNRITQLLQAGQGPALGGQI